MSKISVTTIAGLTSGGDANTVKIESGDDFIVDTSVLKVDATNNRVGIGTASPSRKLELNNGGTGAFVTFTDGVATNFTFKTDGSNVGTFGTEAGSTHLGLMASGTERVRIHSGGVMSVNNGIELGSGLDATAANTLDDYEEGTFTPTLTPGSGSYNGLTLTGFYRKIGSIVHVIMRLNITASGNAGGSAVVGNLPFTSANLSSGLRVTNKMRENAATGVCGQFNINNNETQGFLQNDDGTNIAHVTGRQYMINAMYFSA